MAYQFPYQITDKMTQAGWAVGRCSYAELGQYGAQCNLWIPNTTPYHFVQRLVSGFDSIEGVQSKNGMSISWLIPNSSQWRITGSITNMLNWTMYKCKPCLGLPSEPLNEALAFTPKVYVCNTQVVPMWLFDSEVVESYELTFNAEDTAITSFTMDYDDSLIPSGGVENTYDANGNIVRDGNGNVVWSEDEEPHWEWDAGEEPPMSNATLEQHLSAIRTSLTDVDTGVGQVKSSVDQVKSSVEALGPRLDAVKDQVSSSSQLIVDGISEMELSNVSAIESVESQLSATHGLLDQYLYNMYDAQMSQYWMDYDIWWERQQTQAAVNGVRDAVNNKGDAIVAELRTQGTKLETAADRNGTKVETAVKANGAKIDGMTEWLSSIKTSVDGSKTLLESLKEQAENLNDAVGVDGLMMDEDGEGFQEPIPSQTGSDTLDIQMQVWDASKLEMTDRNERYVNKLGTVEQIFNALVGRWTAVGRTKPNISFSIDIPVLGRWDWDFQDAPAWEFVAVMRNIEALGLWLLCAWACARLFGSVTGGN